MVSRSRKMTSLRRRTGGRGGSRTANMSLRSLDCFRNVTTVYSSSDVTKMETEFLLSAEAFGKRRPSDDAGICGSETDFACFVAPYLPHTIVLDQWSQIAQKLGFRARLLTSDLEVSAFQQYLAYAEAQGIEVWLDLVALESMEENRTFLAGLDEHLLPAKVIVALGESSLSTYQAVKFCRKNLRRLIVWQNAPRPSQTIPRSRLPGGVPHPSLARERSIRNEILKSCDAILCFDKESSTLAYLEGVSPKKIRRLTKGVPLERYNEAFREAHRRELRKSLNMQMDRRVIFQAGPLEVETGIFDTIFALRNLLQSDPRLGESLSLVCCGHGSAAADVRQMVVDYGLDDLVYFISQSGAEQPAIRGDHFSHVLAIADVIIHNPVCPIGGEPYRFLDSTYDLLSAVGYGIPIVSNGSSWIGEWLSRFSRSFSAGNIHSLAKVLRDAIQKPERLAGLVVSSRRALEHDLSMANVVGETAKLIQSLAEPKETESLTDVQSAFAKIEAAMSSQMYVEAIASIEAAFNIPGIGETQQGWLFRAIGDCFTRLGDLKSGRDNYLRAAELDPYSAQVYIGLGTVALQEKHYSIAVPQFHKAVGLEPKNDLANLGLALAFEGLGEARESMNWAVKSCELNCENKPALYHLVKLTYELDDYSDAERIVARYLQRHPYDIHMLYTLGGLRYKLGQSAEAQSIMEDILRIDPMNNLAHSLISQIERDSRNQMKRAAAN